LECWEDSIYTTLSKKRPSKPSYDPAADRIICGSLIVLDGPKRRAGSPFLQHFQFFFPVADVLRTAVDSTVKIVCGWLIESARRGRLRGLLLGVSFFIE
jgi:hypothetical protein